MKWAHNLQHLSAYKRCDAHLTTKTTHGAVVTLLGVLLGVTLTIHELAWFLTAGGVARTAVDLARRHDLAIHMDITFPAIPCAGLSVDVMDASGSSGNDVSRGKDLQIHKIRVDEHGRKLGGRAGEYITPQSQRLVQDKQGTVMQIDLGAAMTQMGDMEAEIKGHEGCRIMGDIVVRRVAGKLHFAVHQQSFVDVLPQMLTGHVLPHLTNMSHVINKVAFGPQFPGQANPLDGFRRITQPGDSLKAYKYFLKIVPTEYLSRLGFKLESNQYSVNEYALTVAGTGPGRGGGGGPGSANTSSAVVTEPFLDFSYDLSPIMMTVAQSPSDLLHFLVRLCAVVGGVMSVTRMADKVVHAVLLAAGVVERPRSVKARHSSSSFAGGYGSARTSYAGGLDTSSLPGSGRSSYAGGVAGGYGSAGGSPHGARATAFNTNGGMLPDGSTHHRSGTMGGASSGGGAAAAPNGGGYLSSHPLSHMSSNASTLQGMGSYGGSLAGMGSYGGGLAGMGSYGGVSAGGGGDGSFGGVGPPGSPPPAKATTGGGFGSAISIGGGGAPAGFGPAAAGPLHKSGSLGGLGSPTGGVAAAGAYGGAGGGSGRSSASGSGSYRPLGAATEGGGVPSSGATGVGLATGGSGGGYGSGGGSLLGRSGGGGGAPAAAAGAGSRGGSSAGGGSGHPLGGFSSAPLASFAGGSAGGAVGVPPGVGSSRLSTASGPGSRPASGPGNLGGGPGSRGLQGSAPQPGSLLKQQNQQ